MRVGSRARSSARSVSNSVPQFVDREPQPIGKYLHRIQGGIRLPILDTAQICLIEAAPLAELHLAQASAVAMLSASQQIGLWRSSCYSS